jgi:hypothetical protein
VRSLVDGVDLHVLHFNQFGKEWIKLAKCSPDAFIQVALQVTFYKLNGKLTSTYESAGLRRFRFGRVDNIRSNTLQALVLARALCNELPNLTVRIFGSSKGALSFHFCRSLSRPIEGRGQTTVPEGSAAKASRSDGLRKHTTFSCTLRTKLIRV